MPEREGAGTGWDGMGSGCARVLDDATAQLHRAQVVPMPSRNRRPSAATDMSFARVTSNAQHREAPCWRGTSRDGGRGQRRGELVVEGRGTAGRQAAACRPCKGGGVVRNAPVALACTGAAAGTGTADGAGRAERSVGQRPSRVAGCLLFHSGMGGRDRDDEVQCGGDDAAAAYPLWPALGRSNGGVPSLPLHVWGRRVGPRRRYRAKLHGLAARLCTPAAGDAARLK